ncbi:Imm26 family immunity protein [Sporichthya polymorpha]|uniref:Imm26 family immunity protein n=1 Tax=Sporichthya polymorpha TaxID=35751 RepID=UPI00036F482C|nr:Imm26 family immunity protein [Sporichthya polymorpha]
MTAAQTNLRVLKPSRKKPQPGDVFAMQLPDESFLFGRVVSTQAQWTLAAGADPANLIYIYRGRSVTVDLPDRAAMRPDRLLVSPIMTNQRPWSMGYFQTLANLPLEAAEVLPRHCFLSASRGRYFDEHGRELPGPVEPVGDHALHSFRTIDDQVSDAMGICRAP